LQFLSGSHGSLTTNLAFGNFASNAILVEQSNAKINDNEFGRTPHNKQANNEIGITMRDTDGSEAVLNYFHIQNQTGILVTGLTDNASIIGNSMMTLADAVRVSGKYTNIMGNNFSMINWFPGSPLLPGTGDAIKIDSAAQDTVIQNNVIIGSSAAFVAQGIGVNNSGQSTVMIENKVGSFLTGAVTNQTGGSFSAIFNNCFDIPYGAYTAATPPAIENFTSTNLDATYNWWGSSGATTDPTVTNHVTGNVTTNPEVVTKPAHCN
jgi:hypothetical protein